MTTDLLDHPDQSDHYAATTFSGSVIAQLPHQTCTMWRRRGFDSGMPGINNLLV
ncbi:hypothetical protein [Methylobacterium sp. UNC378MF]|uniref:hypothetical protein n=1 Tax=Methylobacterium sp. UNC378MF TaxID=1502748 RepID=UPI00158746DE|nr:hypothetical protein [Methylobacterium sp. UNC378MF]